MEVWKDIKGYDGVYQVSNLGRVKSIKFKNDVILKPRKINGGYVRVALSKEGKSRDFLVHRLVAVAFVPNPNNFNEINHKDEIRDNNVVENIEWCTRKYNNNYGNHNLKVSLTGRIPIIAIDSEGNKLHFSSTKEASDILNLHAQNINRCLKKKSKTSGGYSFKYEKPNT